MVETTTEALDALNNVYPFRLLPDEQKAKLAQHADVLKLPAASAVYNENDLATALYIILSGQVELTRVLANDEAHIERLGVLQSGDLFGFELIEEKVACRTSAVTVGSARILRLKDADLFQAVRDTSYLRLPLHLMRDSFLLALHVKLPWREPDEAVIYMARRHPFFLWIKIILPLFIFLISTFVLAYLTFANLPDSLLLGLGMGIAGFLGGVWAIWNIVNWSNDYSIITNRRVVWQERVVMIYDSRQEAPLQTVLTSTTDTSQMGRILGYGDVVLKTFTGTIILPNISQPAIVSIILQERRGSMHGVQRQANLDEIQQSVKNRFSPPPASELEVQPPAMDQPAPNQSEQPQPSRTAEHLANLLRMKTEEGGIITYRQHWLVLLRLVALPIVLVAALLIVWTGGMFRVFTLSDGAMSALGLVLIVILLFWLWYQYEDWANDQFILTADQLVDVYKKPLGQEEKRTAPLKNIQSVEYERVGVISLLLNFGTVYIRIGDAQFTFDNVYNPSDVQSEIFRRMDSFAYQEKKKQDDAVLENMLDILQAYDDLKNIQGQ